MTQKEIIVKNKGFNNFKIGEDVLVEIDEKQALKSIFLAYAVPLVLMILTIIIAINYQQNEIIGGICGIIVLIPYYFGLFLAKDKLKSGFEFKISKKDAKKAVAYLLLCEHFQMQNQYGPNGFYPIWIYKDGKLILCRCMEESIEEVGAIVMKLEAFTKYYTEDND